MDFTMENFSHRAQASASLIPTEFLSAITLRDVLMIAVGLYVLKMLLTFKKTMATVRSIMFTDAALIVGGVYAVLGVGVFSLL